MCFTQIGPIHLVGLAIAELRRRVRRFAERAIKGGSKLRSVAQDGRLRIAVGIERSADRSDAAVHHVAGGDDVGSCAGETGAGAAKQIERWIVVYFPSVASFDDDTAVAVAGVLAEADISDEDQLFCRCALLERAKTLLHDPVVVPCAGGLLVFFVRQTKQEQSADAQARCFFCFSHSFVH